MTTGLFLAPDIAGAKHHNKLSVFLWFVNRQLPDLFSAFSSQKDVEQRKQKDRYADIPIHIKEREIEL